MGIKCNKRWKVDERFLRFRVRRDENENEFIPVCSHPSHPFPISEDRYRERKCEKKGRGYCEYYRRFRPENQERIVYTETQTVELRVQSPQEAISVTVRNSGEDEAV